MLHFLMLLLNKQVIGIFSFNALVNCEKAKNAYKQECSDANKAKNAEFDAFFKRMQSAWLALSQPLLYKVEEFNSECLQRKRELQPLAVQMSALRKRTSHENMDSTKSLNVVYDSAAQHADSSVTAESLVTVHLPPRRLVFSDEEDEQSEEGNDRELYLSKIYCFIF